MISLFTPKFGNSLRLMALLVTYLTDGTGKASEVVYNMVLTHSNVKVSFFLLRYLVRFFMILYGYLMYPAYELASHFYAEYIASCTDLRICIFQHCCNNNPINQIYYKNAAFVFIKSDISVCIYIL